MTDNTAPSASNNKAYILTAQGLVTLNAEDMSPEAFTELTKAFGQIMINRQNFTPNGNTEPAKEQLTPDTQFAFTSAAPVKKEASDAPGIASDTAFGLFDDADKTNAEPVSTVDPLQLSLDDLGITLQPSNDISAPIEKTDELANPSSNEALGIDTPTDTTASETDVKANTVTDDDDDDLEDYIKSTGYISNNNLWRRWIMAQMLRHYNKADGTSGFDEYFVTGTPYYYQWKTMLAELKVLRHLRGDALTDRERFFNAWVLKEMATDYQKKISTYIMKARKRHDRTYKYVSGDDKKRCVYLTIPGYKKRIYLQTPVCASPDKTITYQDFMAMVNKYVEKIKNCPSTHYHNLYQYTESFMKNCPLVKTFAKCSAWKNAFKGSGAYYTMDNMIKFHGCKIHTDDSVLSMEDSLKYLESKTSEYKGEYYRLYALMRKFVEDNNFTYADIPVDNYALPVYNE